jgi:hypothetical protein
MLTHNQKTNKQNKQTKCKQTSKQTKCKQTSKQTNKQTNKQASKQTNKQKQHKAKRSKTNQKKASYFIDIRKNVQIICKGYSKSNCRQPIVEKARFVSTTVYMKPA